MGFYILHPFSFNLIYTLWILTHYCLLKIIQLFYYSDFWSLTPLFFSLLLSVQKLFQLIKFFHIFLESY